jgi:nuclear cap-binding protein subunit 1
VRSLLPWTATAAAAATSSAEAGGDAEDGEATSADDGLQSVLELLDAGEEGFFTVRARWGWYRDFVRTYAKHLTPLDEVVERDLMRGLGGNGNGKEVRERAGAMVRGVWAAGVRGDE